MSWKDPARRLAAVPEPRPPAIRRVVDAAARKGVTLDIRVFDESTHTPRTAAARRRRARTDREVAGVRGAGRRRQLAPVVCLVSRSRTGSTSPAWRRSSASASPPGVGARGPRADRIRHRRHPAVRARPAGPRGHGPRPHPVPVVWAAAGTPTAVFPVPPGTLRILANATVAPIAEERAPTRPVPGAAATRRAARGRATRLTRRGLNAGVRRAR